MRRYAGLAALLIMMAVSVWHYRGDAARQATPEGDCAAAGNCRAAAPERRDLPQGKGFDFYVLSLSWSPSYCASPEGRGNAQQCGAGTAFGFIVHGLWPQNEQGFPQSCPTREPGQVPEALGRTLADIMPGMGLIGHEWRKHGTCSGLSQQNYFSVLRAAWKRVAIPASIAAANQKKTMRVADVEQAMVDANPGLGRRAVAVTCADSRLQEIRICLTKSLEFRDCAAVDREACPLPTITLPAARQTASKDRTP